MAETFWKLPGHELARLVRTGEASATEIAKAHLDRIAATDGRLHAFTDLTADRAIEKAAAIDTKRARGDVLPALAGVPFAVKNLFDVAGLSTRAGSKINRDRGVARRDATLVKRLDAAGGLLVGALNMGEYAYDFTGENSHDGHVANPHDLGRMAGGSSSGSGAALASGQIALSLGSDTNGSIRVPSSFCGLFGLKPTYGRLSRAGTFPFVGSFDHLGPLARSVADLAAAYDAIAGLDGLDPHQAPRPSTSLTPELDKGADGLRIAVLGGHFARNGQPQAFAAVKAVAAALGASAEVELAEAHRARAAAYVITAAEGATLHLGRLRKRAADFDPEIRDRFLAGATVPAVWVEQAQKLRRWFHERALELFRDVDVLLAPSTPCVAPKAGEKTITLDGTELPLRPNIGVFTQPISFIGLPVAAVPVWLPGEALPIGVQVIAAPWREDLALRVAHVLEAAGVARAPVADLG